MKNYMIDFIFLLVVVFAGFVRLVIYLVGLWYERKIYGKSNRVNK